MLESMTGFGRAERTDQAAAVTVEVRSVNGRYLKVQSRLPEELAGREGEVERLVRSRVERGTVTVTVHLRRLASAGAWRMNVDVLRSYAEALAEVKRSLGLSHGDTSVHLEALAGLPGVVEPAEPTEIAEAAWRLTEAALDEALEALVAMRRTEGEALARALLEHAGQVQSALEEVADRAGRVVRDWHERLRKRVQELLADRTVTVSDTDLAREVALLAERADVTEEIDRLRSHLEQFRNALETGSAGGRTLEFLTQEMFRETNTIAAKANDAEISQRVVQMKGQLDRIREQVQNLA